MAPQDVVVEPLAAHRECLPLLQAWFEAEWPAHYGPGGPGDARADLHAFAEAGALPLGVIALHGGQPCGVAVLKAESVPSHRHLGPWAAAGCVAPALRGRGIGARLLEALEHEARALGHGTIYCGTASAASLLERCGWRRIDQATLQGRQLAIYCKRI